MMNPRRFTFGRRFGRGLLGIVSVLLVLLPIFLWVNEGPLWVIVMTRRQEVNGTFFEGDTIRDAVHSRRAESHAYRGWEHVWRWGEHRGKKQGRSRGYYVENGRLAFAATSVNGEDWRYTRWLFDGSVSLQITKDPQTSRAIGLGREERPPSTIQTGYSVSDRLSGVVVSEYRYLPPWWWGVTDQVPRPDGPEIRRFLPSGLKISEKEWKGGRLRRVTQWRRNGTVFRQAKYSYRDGAFLALEVRNESPWWWGVTDQALPRTDRRTRTLTLTEAFPGRTNHVNGNPVRGLVTVLSTPTGDLQHGTTIEYYESTGRKAREFEYEYGSIREKTIWRIDGSIQYQQAGDGSRRREAPYWWGKEPEIQPSAPGWTED